MRTVCTAPFGILIAAAPMLPSAAQPDAQQRRDWPMFGGSPSRNMVNLVDKNLPTDWSVEEGSQKNIKWVADAGIRNFGSPVVADGTVFMGTAGETGDRKAILKAFRAADGKFLWQITHLCPSTVPFQDSSEEGLISTPTVAGASIYYITPACEVICADTADGKIRWRFAMMKELKVVPLYCNTSSPLVIGDLVFVTTGNGGEMDGNLPAPNAPSFAAFHKESGKVVWQSNLPGANIIDGQWSSPTYAEVGGAGQVIFASGDGVIYSFEPTTGKLIWKCDCVPTRGKKRDRTTNPYFLATPTVLGARLYVGLGIVPDGGSLIPWSHFLCLDVTKTGDVSLKSYDAKADVNKNSAPVWAFGGPIEPAPKKGRRVHFGTTLSSAAVHDGLVYIAEEAGYLHCLDAQTGARQWQHDFRSPVWGSAFWADGRVYLGTEDGEMAIFAHGRSEKILATIEMGDNIHSTPVAANGVLYVATKKKLYAIANDR